MDYGRILTNRVPGAKNFKYGELIKSDVALRLGIPNIPNEVQWANLELVAQRILQPVRDRWGRIRITSGFRCPALCLAIGSTARSTHTFGWAVDFEPVDTSIKLFDIMDWIYMNLEFDTLIAEYFPEGWIHCTYSSAPDMKRHRLKLKDPTHNYDVVSIGNLRRLYG
jgi:hypothetical protein